MRYDWMATDEFSLGAEEESPNFKAVKGSFMKRKKEYVWGIICNLMGVIECKQF